MVQVNNESDRLDYPVSIVQGNSSKILKVSRLRDVLNWMVTDTGIKEHTDKIRASKGNDQKKLKETTLAFILGEFKPKREDANIIKYPPVMAFDIDKIPHQHEYQSIFETLQECEFTFLAFPSVRGKGIRFLVCHDAPQEGHREAYLQIAEYYSKFLNISVSTKDKEHCNIDLQCCNISRHWFIGHADIEQVHHNNDSKVFTYIKKESTQAPSGESGSSPDNLKKEDKIKILQLIAGDSHPFANGRQSHVFKFSQLMALNGISQSDALDQVTPLQEEGFDYNEIRGTVVRTYKRINSKGDLAKYSDAQLIGLIKVIDFKNDDTKKKIEKIITVYPEIQQKSDEKELTKYDIALEFIEANYNLEYNEITRFVENNGVRLTDYDYNSIYIALKRNRYKIGKDDTYSLINSDCTPSYNQFHRFVEKNSHYSSNGHLKKLCQTVDTTTGFNAGQSNFAEFFISRWYIGMIACAFGPYVNPLVLVFCGGLNTGKTEWFRRLLPDELKPYMAESKLDNGKDDQILMTDKMMILDDEYGGKSKRDAKHLKEISSKDYFTVRPAYGRTSIRLPRLATLCGTSNEYDVINDITGNRRVVPIKILKILRELYNSIDKTALFMEGFRTYKKWEKERKWELQTKDIEFLNLSTSEFEEVRIEREMFLKYFEKPTDDNIKQAMFFQTTEIITFIQDLHKGLRLSIKRMGGEMRAMNIDKKPGKGANRGQKGYYLIKKSNMQTVNAGF